MTDMPPPPGSTDPQQAPFEDGPPPSIEELLDEAISLVAKSRPLPMSTTVKVNRDDLLDILESALAELPEEIRAAQWLLKEKEEFLAGARLERDDIINQGRDQVSRMVERQEVVRFAEAKARQIVEEARTEARSIRRQTEDYCDQKLASFEVLLEKTIRTVQTGRQKLVGPSTIDGGDLSEGDDPFASPL